MIIGIDARALQEPVRTGVPTYLEQILKRIIPKAPKHEFRLFVNAHDPSKGAWRKSLDFPNVKIIETRWPHKLLHASMLVFHWPKLEKYLGQVDVLFIPTIFFTSFRKNTKIVQTFHDLSFERYGQELSFFGNLWHRVLRPKKVAMRADHILSVSESTKQELKNLYNINPAKITVTHLDGHSDVSTIQAKKSRELAWLEDETPFFLSVGTQEPRKNIPALIEAFDLYKQQTDSKAQLIIAGGSGYSPDEYIDEVVAKSPYRKEIYQLGYVSDEEKKWLYENATGLVFTSLYEGFGLPLLEAFSADIPVLTSSVSSLPEVAQEAALVVDPWRVDQIAEGLEGLANMAGKLRERGQQQRQLFSWDKAADQTLEVLINLGENGAHRN
ncbi:glycosyltransferase family 4 protein [Patescibacteria group bacterium]